MVDQTGPIDLVAGCSGGDMPRLTAVERPPEADEVGMTRRGLEREACLRVLHTRADRTCSTAFAPHLGRHCPIGSNHRRVYAPKGP